MNLVTTTVLHGGAATICVVWAVLVLAAGRGRTALLMAFVLVVQAGWALAVALAPASPTVGLAGLLEVARAAVGFAALLLLYRRAAGHKGRGLVWGFTAAGIIATGLALLSIAPELAAALTFPTLGAPTVLGRIGLALLVVLVAENLYRNAPEAARWHIVLPCIALGGLAAFDVLLYARAALAGGYSPGMADARAVVTAAAAPLLAIAAVRDRRARRSLPVSRDLVFHGTSLMIAGSVLLGVGAAGEALRHLDAAWSRAAGIGLLAAALMALTVASTSQSLRSQLRRLLTDHFFVARYDYRREWLRCVAALSTGESPIPADVRAIRAIADAVDSPAGLLLLRDGAALQWGGSWNAPGEALVVPTAAELAELLRGGDWVAHPAPDQPCALRAALDDLWIVVPLMHHRDGLLGAVLLARPRAAFVLDGEVFALLRTLGREVAMFLAERRSAEQLDDQAHLAAHAQRFAFVAHDVKTVAAQLRLLSGNARDHIADPAFQRDLLITLSAASERIDGLIARLRDPEQNAARPPARLEPLDRLRRLVAARQPAVLVQDDGQPACLVAMEAESFDAALTHLLDNAAEASPPGQPVQAHLRRQGGEVVVEILDGGRGMSAAFIRDALFRPLATTRPRGSGIGAWQARALLREAGGEVTAMSVPGRGTTMRLTLPICGAEAAPPSHRPTRQTAAARP